MTHLSEERVPEVTYDSPVRGEGARGGAVPLERVGSPDYGCHSPTV